MIRSEHMKSCLAAQIRLCFLKSRSPLTNFLKSAEMLTLKGRSHPPPLFFHFALPLMFVSMSCLFYAPPFLEWGNISKILTLYQTMSTHILPYFILNKKLICAWRKQLRTKKGFYRTHWKTYLYCTSIFDLKGCCRFEEVKLFCHVKTDVGKQSLFYSVVRTTIHNLKKNPHSKNVFNKT